MLDALLLTKPPRWLRGLYPHCTWQMPAAGKTLYLTFDDGPIPEVTPFVLDELKRWKARATFFCIGKNVEANPAIFKRIIKEGHTIGNHTFDHLNGWKHKNADYYNNIEKCKTTLGAYAPKAALTHFFRPPYGKLKPSQYKYLAALYQIVMWDIITFDFNPKINGKRVFNATVKHARPGSIIVFHDSLKAGKNVTYALPKVLEYFTKEGFKFEAL